MSGAALEAFSHGAGLVALPGVATVEVRGTAARDYLHRMLSQDVKTLAAGASRRACFLTVQGRVLLDLLVLASPDGFTLVCDGAAAVTGLPALERYVITEDVAFRAASPALAHSWLVGPSASAALSAAGAPVPDAGRFLPWAVSGGEGWVLRRDLGDRPGFRLAVPAAAASALREALVGRGRAVPASARDFDAARVDAGEPWWGAEVDDRVMPTEAGLADAVSFTKGCYLGQEPVTMSKHRGHPPSLLCRFAVAGGGAPVLAGAALTAGGARVGRLTTVAPASGGGARALGYAAFAQAKAGAASSVEGTGLAARVEAVLA